MSNIAKHNTRATVCFIFVYILLQTVSEDAVGPAMLCDTATAVAMRCWLERTGDYYGTVSYAFKLRYETVEQAKCRFSCVLDAHS